MKHPKRAITRDIRTRNPKRAGRVRRELMLDEGVISKPGRWGAEA
jgi:hypothetical protein